MPKPPPKFEANGPQGGMTLVEILVAIVVLSIGLLGLAGLQLKGAQVNQGSQYRWQAAMLVEDMADRIRADKAGALSGNYTLGPAPATTASPPTSGPSVTQRAITDWLARVALLPGASVTIAPLAGGAANQFQVEVDWIDTRARAGAGEVITQANAGVLSTFPMVVEF